MTNIFFTSDTHYFHDNIIKYCNRPYNSVDHMNEMLVQNWNEVVKPADVVYHLGDLSFKVAHVQEELHSILRRLNGTKHLILGNHDRQIKSNMDTYRPYFASILHRKMLNQSCLLSHHPVWDDKNKPFMRHGGWVLHGHEHGTKHRHYCMIDVGVDAHNYYPISLEEVATIMRTKRKYIYGEQLSENSMEVSN